MAPTNAYQPVEVSASSAPKDVVGAIVGAAAPPKPPNNPIKCIQFSFVFILLFGAIVYFREEIYTFGKDVRKYPILSGEESAQVSSFVGGKWKFGRPEGAAPIHITPAVEEGPVEAPVVVPAAADIATTHGHHVEAADAEKESAAPASEGRRRLLTGRAAHAA